MNWNKYFYGFTIQTSVNAMYLSLGAVLCAVKIDKDNKIKINIILFVLTVLFVIATFFTTRRGYKLENGLSDIEQTYCNVLRDADKIDIFRVNCDILTTRL